jgi:26S proteasome regulatory subunit T6
MYALRERRQHVSHKDFELAIAKVVRAQASSETSVNQLLS